MQRRKSSRASGRQRRPSLENIPTHEARKKQYLRRASSGRLPGSTSAAKPNSEMDLDDLSMDSDIEEEVLRQLKQERKRLKELRKIEKQKLKGTRKHSRTDEKSMIPKRNESEDEDYEVVNHSAISEYYQKGEAENDEHKQSRKNRHGRSRHRQQNEDNDNDNESHEDMDAREAEQEDEGFAENNAKIDDLNGEQELDALIRSMDALTKATKGLEGIEDIVKTAEPQLSNELEEKIVKASNMNDKEEELKHENKEKQDNEIAACEPHPSKVEEKIESEAISEDEEDENDEDLSPNNIDTDDKQDVMNEIRNLRRGMEPDVIDPEEETVQLPQKERKVIKVPLHRSPVIQKPPPPPLPPTRPKYINKITESIKKETAPAPTYTRKVIESKREEHLTEKRTRKKSETSIASIFTSDPRIHAIFNREELEARRKRKRERKERERQAAYMLENSLLRAEMELQKAKSHIAKLERTKNEFEYDLKETKSRNLILEKQNLELNMKVKKVSKTLVDYRNKMDEAAGLFERKLTSLLNTITKLESDNKEKTKQLEELGKVRESNTIIKKGLETKNQQDVQEEVDGEDDEEQVEEQQEEQQEEQEAEEEQEQQLEGAEGEEEDEEDEEEEEEEEEVEEEEEAPRARNFRNRHHSRGFRKPSPRKTTVLSSDEDSDDSVVSPMVAAQRRYNAFKQAQREGLELNVIRRTGD